MMKRNILLFIFLLGVFGAAAQIAPPRVNLTLSRDTILLGDQITLSVEIDKDVAQDVRVPEFKDGKMSEFIEVIGTPTLDTISSEGRQMKLRLNYTITSFDAGDYSLKDYSIVSGVDPNFDTIRATNEAILHVTTFEIDTTKQQIFDIKRPMDTPLTWAEAQPYVLWGLLGLVVLGGLIYGVIWYMRRRREALENRPRDPMHVVALRELEELHSKKLWQSGKTKEYFSELTDIVREYIEGRYAVEAMEMTSAEIIAAMKEINNDKLITTLRTMFEVSDLVKFAKMSPDGTECETAYFDAYYYVEQTKEIVETETQDNETK